MIAKLRSLMTGPPAETEPPLGELKLRAIDHACEQLGCRSVADLGGVWAVDGGYALHAADAHDADRVVICDDDFTSPLLDRATVDERLELVEGNFGRAETVERIGEVDAIILFDVLLHQVRPDWDEILAIYAPVTRAFIVAGPWWNGPETVRLVELGRADYLDAVPLPEFHAEVWEKLDEHNPARGRAWRDCHDIWQWGITEADLRARMGALGFAEVHREHAGSWMGLERFEDVAFVFGRADA